MKDKIKTILQIIGRQKWWILAYVVAIVIRVALAVPLVHDWDGFVFSESAKNMLKGVTPYMTVEDNDPSIYPDSDRPMTEQWLGYPPLPLLMFTAPYALAVVSGIPITPVLENFILKIPFILGDILCAYLVMKFLKDKNKQLAERASLLILFNPLLIWVSSAWGMFDLWIVNFLLLFLLALRSKRVLLAGFFLALAPQVKLFPVFFLPAVFIYFFQTITQGNQRIKFFLTFVITTLLIDIPFFLSSPQGFMNQNLIMHLNRPPQGIGFVAMLDFLSHVYRFNISTFITVTSILTIPLILLFNLLSLVFIKGKEYRLLTIIFLIYTASLVFNKVVNEQYFVVLVGLLIILTHLPIEVPTQCWRRLTQSGTAVEEEVLFSKRFLTWLEAITSFSVLVAAVVLGFHFLTFLPPFLSEGYLKVSTNYLVFYLSKLVPQLPLYTYPNSLWTYYNAPVALTYIILAPLLLLLIYVILKGIVEVFRVKKEIWESISNFFTIPKPTAAVFLSFILSFTVAVFSVLSVTLYVKEKNVFTLVDLTDSSKPVQFPTTPRIGTFYNVWWNNPSHRKDLPNDAWTKTTLNPEIGYYTSKNSYFTQHIKQMKDTGIDFAVVSYHLYDRERYLTFGKYAEKLGIYYAPLVETGDALENPEFHPDDPKKGSKFLEFAISEESRKEYTKVIISSIEENYKSKALLRINGKPVIFIYDGQWFYPSFDSSFKQKLADRIIAKYQNASKEDSYSQISTAWDAKVSSVDDVLTFYPEDIPSFDLETSSAKDYRQAFIDEYVDYWKNIRKDVEEKVGPVYLLSTYSTPTPSPELFVIKPFEFPSLDIFDNEFFYSLSNTWAYWKNVAVPETIMEVWEKQESEHALRDREKGWPVFLTVTPVYKDTIVRGKLGFEIPATVNGRSIYDWAWETALENKPDYILIATWNEFFEGSAIEPSKEYGSYYLQATKQWVERFKNSSLAQNQ